MFVDFRPNLVDTGPKLDDAGICWSKLAEFGPALVELNPDLADSGLNWPMLVEVDTKLSPEFDEFRPGSAPCRSTGLGHVWALGRTWPGLGKTRPASCEVERNAFRNSEQRSVTNNHTTAV